MNPPESRGPANMVFHPSTGMPAKVPLLDARANRLEDCRMDGSVYMF